MKGKFDTFGNVAPSSQVLGGAPPLGVLLSVLALSACWPVWPGQEACAPDSATLAQAPSTTPQEAAQVPAESAKFVQTKAEEEKPAKPLVDVQKVVGGRAGKAQPSFSPAGESAFIAPIAEDIARFGKLCGDLQSGCRCQLLDGFCDRFEMVGGL